LEVIRKLTRDEITQVSGGGGYEPPQTKNHITPLGEGDRPPQGS
jgi:hypothetical protein